MNDISKRVMLGENIHNIPLRVCYYARVSTDSDKQLNSLDNQIDYYENYIKSNNNWSFTKGYIDEGVSALRVDKRDSFKEMIYDAKDGLFDLIITKEVSRFARNLEDSIHYVRLLRDYEVGIYFENQNLNTFDNNSELILNIMFNLAEEESRKLSSRIKFGHKEAIKKGHVLGSSNITGYTKNNCKLVINDKEALFIKRLYELYAAGNYGFLKLAKTLKEEGYVNKNNKLYDKESLKRIIRNPKYKGYFRSLEYETVNYRTKKRKKNELDKQIIYKTSNNIIPPIVSEELWNKANNILSKRIVSIKNKKDYSLRYPFSSKIYCYKCNLPFERITARNKKKWVCANYIKYGVDKCSSPILNEIELYEIFKDLLLSISFKDSVIIKELNELYNKDLSIYIKEIIDDNILKEFIRVFLNKIIVKKRDDNRKKVILDIYLNNIVILRYKKDYLFNDFNYIININK